jgi:hypothetical protein
MTSYRSSGRRSARGSHTAPSGRPRRPGVGRPRGISEADAALAARPEGVSLVRMQLEDDLEVARRELKSAQQDLEAAEGPLISRLVICRLSTGQSLKL